MMNQRWMKTHNKGTILKIENAWNRKTGRAGVHAHLLTISSSTRDEFETWINEFWTIGKVKDFKRYTYKGVGSVMEITKPIASYLNKAFSWQTVEQLTEMIYAFRGVRAFSTTGVFRELISQIKESEKGDQERESEATAKQPPKDPEVLDLPFGTYDKCDLMWQIYQGSYTALWLLRWLEFYQHEARLIGRKTGVEAPDLDGS